MKKVLIIGGSSSICDEIVLYLEKNDCFIDLLTYRYEENKKNIKNNEKYQWMHIDLTHNGSTLSAIKNIKEDYYDIIVCVPTHASGGRDPMATSREYLEELYGKFIINYIDLIRNLIFKKLKKDGKFVFISSEAANAVTDVHDYAAAKATIQAYVRSLAKKAEEKTIIVIATTGIHGSLAYHQHGGDDYYKFDMDRWVQKEQIAKIIVDSTRKDNGNIYTLGFIPSKTKIINIYSGIVYPYQDRELADEIWHNPIKIDHGRPDGPSIDNQ
jgi:short-subunit dehydrogenase